MWIRVCRYKNAGVAGYAEAFIPVQSDSQASEWYSYFEKRCTSFYFHFFLSNMHLYRADLRCGIPADPPLFQAFQRFRRRMPVPVVFTAGNQDQLRLCQIQQCFSRRVGCAVVPGVEDGAAEGILRSGMVLTVRTGVPAPA